MLEQSLFDETFDKNRSDVYHIYILLSTSGVTFTLYDPDSKKYVALKHHNIKPGLPQNMYIEEVEKHIDNEDIYNIRFKKARIINQTRKSIFIPETLFDKNKLKKFFEFNYPMNELDVIQFNKISIIKAYNIFTIHNRIMTCYMDKLPGVTFYHQATPLITKAVSEQTNQATQVLVDINNDFFDIVVTQFGKLKLHNAYLYQKEDDILYYILFVLKQSFLDPSKTPVLLSGDIDSNGSLIKLLEKYLPRLDFNQPDKSFTYSYKLNKVPEHTVFTLYNLIHCE